MAWDESKNKVIMQKKIKLDESKAIVIAASSYAGGPVKIATHQIVTDKNDKEWVSHVKSLDPIHAKKFGIAIKKMAIELLEKE